MHTPTRAALLILALLALGFAAWKARPPTPDHSRLTCRPSNPAQAVAADPRPAILMLGNSLIFDHNWRLPQHHIINCARQGLTLNAALPAMTNLPKITPTHVILSFGSVELLRAALHNTPLDPADFADQVTELNHLLNRRWPEAQITWLSLPNLPNTPAAALIPQINSSIKDAVAPNTLVNTDSIFATLTSAPSYDGTHLSHPAYLALEDALTRARHLAE